MNLNFKKSFSKAGLYVHRPAAGASDGGRSVCSPVASRMGWSFASQPESYAGRFQEDVGSVDAGRSADGQMSAVPVEHLGDWELLRECSGTTKKVPVSVGAAGLIEGRQQVSDPMDTREPSHLFEPARTPHMQTPEQVHTLRLLHPFVSPPND